MKNHTYLLAIFVFIASMECPISYAITAQSTFDSGFDGWRHEGSGNLYYVSQGGVPGGFVEYVVVMVGLLLQQNSLVIGQLWTEMESYRGIILYCKREE
jgi:hypothetical protein